MSGSKNFVLQQLEEHPFHIMVEALFAIALAYILFQRRRKQSGSKGKAAVVEMPSLEEQERRIAAFQSAPFRAECKPSSLALVPAYKGMHDVRGRRGCHVTVSGSGFKEPTECLDLGTFDYHSFSTHPEVVEVARNTVMAYGVGSCGPRGFYGTVKPHLDCEEDLAKFCGTEDAIVYSFGYATIATLISCYASRGDYVVCDSGVNSSVEEGCLLSRAHLVHYAHNDMAVLEKELQAVVAKDNGPKPSRRFVVTEGVFKNSGDICALPQIMELCLKYKFRVILEDSYGFGAIGKTGRGTPEHFGKRISDVDIYVSSMNTSLGGVGGFCAGDTAMVDHQRLGATAYVFSASLPPYVTAACSQALKLMDRDPSHVNKLQSNARVARKTLRDANFNKSKIALVECDGDVSPLVVLQVPSTYVSSTKLTDVENKLQKVVNAVEENKVIVLRHMYTTDEPTQDSPSLMIVIKSAVAEDELRAALQHVVKAVKAEFS